MLSAIGNLLLLPWSLVVKLAMSLGSVLRGLAGAAFWVVLFVGGALLANKLLSRSSRSAPAA